jgi:hypothetical protein
MTTYTCNSTYHNVFEKHHRFIGWLGLATTWMFVIMGNSYAPSSGHNWAWEPNAHVLLSSQELWFAVFMTIL